MNIHTGAIRNAATDGGVERSSLAVGNANISAVDITWKLHNGSGEFCDDGTFEVRNFVDAGGTSNGTGKFDSANTFFEGKSSGANIDGTFQLGFYEGIAGSIERINLPIDGGR
jgi:hypothetical protein